jgi:hypothetical protein
MKVISDSNSHEWILAHRGYWKSVSEMNTAEAIAKALQKGFGVETDFRDFQGNLVLSHDIIDEQELIPFNGFSSSDRYAINLKSDGLAKLLLPDLSVLIQSNSFVFDGSIPEMIRYRDSGIPHALRLSEYETELPWKSQYVWVDAFESDWWISDNRLKNLFSSHHLVFVSPELHGRDHRLAFEAFVDFRRTFGKVFSVCTDLPSELLELSNE